MYRAFTIRKRSKIRPNPSSRLVIVLDMCEEVC